MKRAIALFIICSFVLSGCIPPGQIKKHTAPGQIKKHTAPGQIKKKTGYNPASGKFYK